MEKKEIIDKVSSYLENVNNEEDQINNLSEEEIGELCEEPISIEVPERSFNYSSYKVPYHVLTELSEMDGNKKKRKRRSIGLNALKPKVNIPIWNEGKSIFYTDFEKNQFVLSSHLCQEMGLEDGDYFTFFDCTIGIKIGKYILSEEEIENGISKETLSNIIRLNKVDRNGEYKGSRRGRNAKLLNVFGSELYPDGEWILKEKDDEGCIMEYAQKITKEDSAFDSLVKTAMKNNYYTYSSIDNTNVKRINL